AETGDSGSIQALARRLDSSIGGPANPGQLTLLRYAAAVAPAYLAVARHDTTDALRRFAAAPDSLCLGCYLGRLTHARLLLLKGQDREAARLLDQSVFGPQDLAPSEVALALQRA